MLVGRLSVNRNVQYDVRIQRQDFLDLVGRSDTGGRTTHDVARVAPDLGRVVHLETNELERRMVDDMAQAHPTDRSGREVDGVRDIVDLAQA
jgi:hypothetical protein